jgi:Glycosyltransferase family 87
VIQEWSRRPWEPALLLGFAVFATLYALITRNLAHELWAAYAAVSYAASAVALVARPVRRMLPTLAQRRWLVVALLVMGTTVAPLAHQVVDGIANPEIQILCEAADRWRSVGTPFPTEAELAGRVTDVNAYNVYLPLLAVFGLPSAAFGPSPIADPRIYLALVSFTIFLLLGRRASWPVVLFITSPWVALQLVSGTTDIPVLGFVLVGLMLAGRERFGWAGVAMGIAAGLKALAWPAVAIALILVGVRGKWRGLTRFIGMVALVLVAALGLPVLADPAAFVVNAIELPLGVLPIKLTAQSPLPGYLLSQAGPVGHVIVLVLLGSAALTIGVRALRRPPQNAATAARWTALGMLVAVLLAPATRYGYLVYSVGLLLLPVLAGDSAMRRQTLNMADRDLADRPAAARSAWPELPARQR